MNRYWNNLRPFEKRLLVLVGTVLFIVLNLWFVVPHFSDWERVKGRMAKAQRELEMFQATLRKVPDWERTVATLEGEGLAVPLEDQLHHFSSAIQEQAVMSGVTITTSGKTPARTNQFFIEQGQTLGLISKEQNLVDFLYNLGSGNSLIRVRDLTLRPDQPRQQLLSNVKLVASYQKKPTKAPPKAAATPPPAPAQPPAKAAPPATQAKNPQKTNAPAGQPAQTKSILPASKPATSKPATSPP